MKVADDGDSQRPSTLSHVVNIRKMLEPSLGEVSLGNIMWGTVAHHFSTTRNEEFEGLELSKLLNEVDFGWGKPLWSAIAGDPNEMMGNIIVLVDNVLDDGSTEAWILLDEKEMQLLEQIPQFLEFALLNPSINLPHDQKTADEIFSNKLI
ncbi:salutaridinol 7-O-acetyltransferase-like [Cucumis melo var. makuwa]|uniref:Salutaridinol 7-O-acetyltransferase-like n=1 Tax=Cucumis melo var. makuwa TaxID=1194695 RepID=A0A5D3CZL1_CUCMM|nr:salutaridinol 7-O-acetyltransferase-like [Cucumis melo var. makuwa]